MMCATNNGNPNTTIVSRYSPTNTSDEKDITNFNNQLSSLARHNLKQNLLIIGRDMIGQIGKNENKKFCYWNSPNRNSEYLADFLLENKPICINIKF